MFVKYKFTNCWQNITSGGNLQGVEGAGGKTLCGLDGTSAERIFSFVEYTYAGCRKVGIQADLSGMCKA
jgi:hypothetical protein